MGNGAGNAADAGRAGACATDAGSGEYGAVAADERSRGVSEFGGAVWAAAGVGIERGAEQIGFRSGVGGIVWRDVSAGAGRAISGSGVVSAGVDRECGGV